MMKGTPMIETTIKVAAKQRVCNGIPAPLSLNELTGICEGVGDFIGKLAESDRLSVILSLISNESERIVNARGGEETEESLGIENACASVIEETLDELGTEDESVLNVAALLVSARLAMIHPGLGSLLDGPVYNDATKHLLDAVFGGGPRSIEVTA